MSYLKRVSAADPVFQEKGTHLKKTTTAVSGNSRNSSRAAMPELAEIKRFSYIINSNGRGKTFKEPRLALPPPFAGNAFRMHAIARGKELRVTLSLDTNPDSKIWVLFTHGLVGRWIWRAGPPQAEMKGVQLSFEATDGQGALQFIDIQKMGKWNVTTESWGKGRGADPVDEFELFKKNILDNRAKKDFEQPIGELMLDQKYFNGVGNYLRAEVSSLFRSQFSRLLPDPVSSWYSPSHEGFPSIPE